MKNKKNKIIFLLTGILIGIIIGVGIMWCINQNKKKLSLINTSSFIKKQANNRLNYNKTVKNKVVNKISKNKQDNPDAINTKKDSALLNDSLYVDSVNKNLVEKDSVEMIKNNNTDSLNEDSIVEGETISTSQQNENNIVVMKDKLVFVRQINLTKSEEIADTTKNSYLDSLLTDQKYAKKKSPNIYRVEFWKSPINYKGYKLIKDKLILFGIEQFDLVSLNYFNKKLYIKYLNDYYFIEETDNFRPFVQLKDKKIIDRINKISNK